MTEAERQALHAVDVIARIEQRLLAAGDIRGLQRLGRMSLDELDLLVMLELGMAA